MATFKITVQKQRTDGYWPVYIRVVHHRQPFYLKTEKIVDNKGLNKSTKEVKDPFVRKELDKVIVNYIDRLNKVDTSAWTVHDVVRFLRDNAENVCFSDYARKYAEELYNQGHDRNAKNYTLALQHLELYAGTNKIMFSQLTSTFINNWIRSLMQTARAKEMYPVCIRQVFRQALAEYNDYDSGIIRITTNPWPKVNIPKSDTPQKRAITMEQCRAFFSAPLPENDRKYPLSELGRDVAMMILCLAGINTVDIYNLKKEDYKNQIISYERAKTRAARSDNAYFQMRVPDILLPVVEKYRDKSNSPYLFVFKKRLTSSDSFNANVNIGIKQICKESLKMKKEDLFSAYTFRHTWATVAQNECGASLSDVDFALNHSNKTQLARTYVKIDFSPAWELNEKVVNKIFFTEEKSNDHVDVEKSSFEKFSFKQLMKGTLYFRGKAIASVEDIGFNNVNEIIAKLMAKVPKNIPVRSMVQIRIENKDKGQTKDYTRVIK